MVDLLEITWKPSLISETEGKWSLVVKKKKNNKKPQNISVSCKGWLMRNKSNHFSFYKEGLTQYYLATL